ncbi:MAG TPA: ABC transporter ATP-binding protein [Methanomicrobia archaeon]|nr:ABC transporter ATP-binding protein [Methanomicrobia archaeon]
MQLSVSSLNFSFPTKVVLRDVSFSAHSGEVFGIVGPNGSGKTTLLRCLRLVLSPQGGAITLDDEDVMTWDRSRIARVFGVVPQSTTLTFPFSVFDVVMMGRIPHLGRFQREGAHDISIVRESMKLTSIDHLFERPISQLSGGELQRVIIARALAQEPRVLLLDEPTSQLDINHQFEVMKLVRSFAIEHNMVVIIISHNLNLSLRYCDRLLLLKDGGVHSCGASDEVLTPDNIREVYGVEAQLDYNKRIGAHQLTLIDAIERD